MGGSYYSAYYSPLCTVLEAAGEKQTFQNQTGLKLNCVSATCHITLGSVLDFLEPHFLDTKQLQ